MARCSRLSAWAAVLAALAVPEARFAEVANQVNTLPEVAHNDQRNHRLNMWFVLATAQPDGIARACARIEADTGLAVQALSRWRMTSAGKGGILLSFTNISSVAMAQQAAYQLRMALT